MIEAKQTPKTVAANMVYHVLCYAPEFGDQPPSPDLEEYIRQFAGDHVSEGEMKKVAAQFEKALQQAARACIRTLEKAGTDFSHTRLHPDVHPR